MARKKSIAKKTAKPAKKPAKNSAKQKKANRQRAAGAAGLVTAAVAAKMAHSYASRNTSNVGGVYDVDGHDMYNDDIQKPFYPGSGVGYSGGSELYKYNYHY